MRISRCWLASQQSWALLCRNDRDEGDEAMLELSIRLVKKLVIVAGSLAAAVTLAGCGSSSTNSAASNPGTMLGTANVAGLGNVVTDGRGRTIYILTSGDGHTNVACTDASGCTKVWPDLSLPEGVSAATAGSGIQAALLGTMKVGDENYPTYNGWLLYEYSADARSGQANGQGINSFGGTWYVLNPAGNPITSKPSSSGGGY